MAPVRLMGKMLFVDAFKLRMGSIKKNVLYAKA
jgi:hypothetical protein